MRILALEPRSVPALPAPKFPAPPVTLDPPLDRVELRPIPLDPDPPLLKGNGEAPYYDAAADAKDRASYYGDLAKDLKDLDGATLYDRLGKLVRQTHKPLDYQPSQHLYPWVDRRPNLQIESIYSGRSQTGAPAQPPTDPGQFWLLVEPEGPSTMVFDEVQGLWYNCEHVVPQSWFDKRGPMRGDLHHLFASEIRCNSIRGNSIYWDFMDREGETLPQCGIKDGPGNRFEPEGGRGASARAVLYFLMRYPGEIGDESGEYSEKDLETLKRWSREEPPSLYEQHRNRAIQGRQGNRNPLIDFPELVDRIDFRRGLGTRGRKG